MISRRNALAGAAGSLLLGQGVRAQAPRRGGTLTAQVYSDLHTLNPALRASWAIHVFTSKMIEPLVDLDAQGQPQGKLAIGWESTPDGKTITFHLRPNVAWHDGKPFTSADVQFCAMHMWKPYQNYGSLLHKALTSVDTPNEHTAVFNYAEPMPLPLLIRACPELAYVVPRHIFATGDVLNNPANLRPIGTGPYRFVSYAPGQNLIMERNPDYWVPGQPYLDRVVIRVIADPSSAAAALEAGEIDISLFSSLPRADLVRLAADSAFRVSTRGNEANVIDNTLGFNLARKELADVRVRRALAHSLDIEFYADNFLYGYGERAHGPIPSTSGFYIPGAAPDYLFDPRRAEALLDEAGYPRSADGTRMSLRLLPNRSDDIHMLASFMQQAFGKLGVKTEIASYDAPGYNANVNRDHTFDLATDTGTFRGDPAVGTTIWYHSGMPPAMPWSNQWGYRSAALDSAVDAAAVELNPARRKALYAEFSRVANTDIPVWMAIEQLFVSATAARVRDDHNTPRWPSSAWADVWLAA